MKQVVLIVVFFSLIAIVQAQTLPTPEDIFAEGVQWSYIEYEPEPISDSVDLDNDKKIIQFYDSSEDSLHDFPYPDEVDYLQHARILDDGFIELSRNYESLDYDPDRYIRAGYMFLLDPETGKYQELPLVCQDRIIQSENDAGRWTVVHDLEDYQKAFLCHSGTGQELQILPDGYFDWDVSLSPDGDWLIISGYSSATGIEVYSYNLPNNEMIQLGVMSGSSDMGASICGWVTDIKGILCNSLGVLPYTGFYYTFDLTQTNSVKYVFSGWWRENIIEIEEPTRFTVMLSEQYISSNTGSVSRDHQPCRIITYDAEGLETLDLGYECRPLWIDDYTIAPYIRNEDTIYFLTVDHPEATIAELHAYDARAKSDPNLPIFSGEIESILSVSPDGQYAVLLMDDNGKLDFSPMTGYCCLNDKGFRVVIIRIDDIGNIYAFDIVYRSDAIGVYIPPQVAWLDSNTVVIATRETGEMLRMTEDGNIIPYFTPSSLHRITIGSAVDIAITTRFGFQRQQTMELNISPNNRYVELPDGKIIDLMTFNEITIFRDNLPDEFYYSTSWLDDNDLRVNIQLKSDYKISAEYHVDLP